MKDLVVYIMKSTNPIKWEEWGRIGADGGIIGPEDFSQVVKEKIDLWDLDILREPDRERFRILMGGVRMKTRME